MGKYLYGSIHHYRLMIQKVNVLSNWLEAARKAHSSDSFYKWEINRFTIENLSEERSKNLFYKILVMLAVVASLDNNRIKRQSGHLFFLVWYTITLKADLYSNKNVPFHIKKRILN